MAKKCSICGQLVDTGAIMCPQCGCGVFETTKVHPGSENLVAESSDGSEVATGTSSRGGVGAWVRSWKGLFGGAKTKDSARTKRGVPPAPHTVTDPLALPPGYGGFIITDDSNIRAFLAREGLLEQFEKGPFSRPRGQFMTYLDHPDYWMLICRFDACKNPDDNGFVIHCRSKKNHTQDDFCRWCDALIRTHQDGLGP